MYLLKVIAKFSSSHIIHGYDGPCSRLHGHNWKVEAIFHTNELDELGMGVDFKVLKQATQKIANDIDHRHLNDLPAFASVNPTAEHIARWFYQTLKEQTGHLHASLHKLIIWETDNCAVEYSESEIN